MADWNNCKRCGKGIDWRDSICSECEEKESRAYHFEQKYKREQEDKRFNKEYQEWKKENNLF